MSPRHPHTGGERSRRHSRAHLPRTVWLVIGALLGPALPPSARATDHAGVIVLDETWTAADNPHRLTDNTAVTEGATVTIAAGCRVVATDRINLDVVNGGLIVAGAPGNEVLFSGREGGLGWGGIRVGNGGVLACTGGVVEMANYGIRVLNQASVSLSACVLRNNDRGLGLRVLDGFSMSDCIIEDNTIGIALDDMTGVHMSWPVKLRNNQYGVYLSRCANVELHDLTIAGSTAGAVSVWFSREIVVGPDNVIGGPGHENLWPVLLRNDANLAPASVIPTTGNTNNAIGVDTAEPLVKELVWHRIPGVGYGLIRSLNVGKFGHLKIEPGCVVRGMRNVSGIDLTGGTLTAVGAPGNEVRFESAGDGQAWLGIAAFANATVNLEHCIVGAATVGLAIHADGAASLRSCTLRGNHRGLWAEQNADLALAECTVTGGTFGLYLTGWHGGSLTGAATIDRNAFGVFLDDCDGVQLDNLVLTGNLAAAIYANDSRDLRLGAGNVIGGAGGANQWPLSLYGNSSLAAGSRLAAAGNTRNAIEVGGAITESLTWQKLTGLDYELTSDVVVGGAGHLAVEPGITVRAGSASTDIAVSGGALELQGVPGYEVRVVGDGLDAPWPGISVADGGQVRLDHAVIEGAQCGVSARDGGAATLTACAVHGNDVGLAVDDGGHVSATDTAIEDNDVGVRGVAGDLAFTRCSVVANASAGIELVAATAAFGTGPVTWNRIHGNGDGQPGRDLRAGQADVTAEYVCWGPTTPPHLAVWDHADDDALGVVDYAPWLNGDNDLSGVDDGAPGAADLPRSFAAYPPSPNPSNPRASLRFDLPRAEAVRLAVFDIAGRRVRTLLDGEVVAAGRRSAVWDGTDDRGGAVASGVYLYRLEAGPDGATGRLLLVR